MLALVFLVLVAGILAAGYRYHNMRAREFREGLEEQLLAIANLRSERVSHWKAEQLRDARLYQGNVRFNTLVRSFLLLQASEARRSELLSWIEGMRLSGYHGVALLDAEGRVKLTTSEDAGLLDAAVAAGVREAMRTGSIVFVDLYRSEVSGSPLFSLVIPIFDGTVDGGRVGTLVWHIDPETEFFRLLRKWPVPSSSAETFLVRRDGDEVVFLNDLRFLADAALRFRLPISRVDIPAVRAVLGFEGVVEGVDYRGRPALAAVHRIPDTPWYMVARIDRTEAEAPLQAQVQETLLLVAALLLASGAGVGLILRRHQAHHYRDQYVTLQALHGSEKRYRALTDAALDAIITVNAEGAIDGWNRGAERMFRYTEADVIGQPFARIISPEGGTNFLEALQSFQAGGRPPLLESVIELEGLRKDGTGFPMEVSVAAWRLSDQGFLTATIRDITERRLTEENLRVQSAALGAAANSILIANRDGTIVWVNTAFTRLTGYSLEEALGLNLCQLVGLEGGKCSESRPPLQTLLTGQSWRGEVTSRRKDGSAYREELTITPVPDASGEIAYFVALQVDLTERIRAEESLRASLAEKETLLKEVHHRVKNNLQVVTSLLRLEAGRCRHPETKTTLGSMRGRIRAMALLHDTLYRSDNLGSVRLADYLGKIATQVVHAFPLEPGAIELRLDLAPTTMEMDPAISCGLLVNELVTNCLKHGFPDGRTGEIRVTLDWLEDGARRLRLRVSDNGVGLPADFEARRTHSLGLQLVDDLVRQLRGSFQAGSAEPGAVFTVTFIPSRPGAMREPSDRNPLAALAFSGPQGPA